MMVRGKEVKFFLNFFFFFFFLLIFNNLKVD